MADGEHTSFSYSAESQNVSTSSKKKWLTWAGALAFIFFLAKGLLWLSLPTLLIWFGTH